MVKTHSKKKRCSFQGCRKMAVDDYNCRLHAVAKDAAVEEAVEEKEALDQGIERTAKKISSIRETVKTHGASLERYGFSAICFNAGKILGGLGAYLEGK